MRKIERQLKLGLIDEAKVNLAKYYNKEHKSAWLEVMRAEYDSIYPISRNMSTVEYELAYANKIDNNIEIYTEEYTPLFDNTIVIDYSEDKNYITFNEWLAETIVVQEAVEEVWDEQGLDILVEAVPEITEQVRPYTPMTTEEVEAKVDSYIYAATLPKVITMRQARLALLNAGLLATVSDAISAGTDEALKIEWDYATEVKRDWASLEAIATSLGMTSEQLDELFIAGSKL